MKNRLAFLALSGWLAAGAAAADKPAEPTWKHTPGTYAVLATGKGTIVCRLFADKTPRTVANFIDLAEGAKTKTKFYDGTKFHRVIPGFMIQGGDPQGTGEGGPGYEFDDEIVQGLGFDRPGLLAMANSGLRPDGHGTNGSQFFITDAPRGGYARLPTHLNGHHTIFGELVEGKKVVSAIADTPTRPDSNGMAVDPVVLKSVTIVRVTHPKDEAAPAVAKKKEAAEAPARAKAEEKAAPAAMQSGAPAAAPAAIPPEASPMNDGASAEAVRGAVEPPKPEGQR